MTRIIQRSFASGTESFGAVHPYAIVQSCFEFRPAWRIHPALPVCCCRLPFVAAAVFGPAVPFRAEDRSSALAVAAGTFAGRAGDRICLRVGYLDGAGGGWRGSPADLGPGGGVTTTVFAGRQAIGVCVDAHGRRRPLCTDVCDGTTAADHVLGFTFKPGCVVEGRGVAVLYVVGDGCGRAG